MKEIPIEVINFLHKQSFVLVSTIDANSYIHCAAKGIVHIEKEGKVYLIDLYRGSTFKNLKNNPTLSITSIDEQHFKGFTLKGKASMVEKNDFDASHIKAWEEKVIKRISQRLIKSVQDEKGNASHPEAHLPPVQYLIELKVEEIVDLTPAHIKRQP